MRRELRKNPSAYYLVDVGKLIGILERLEYLEDIAYQSYINMEKQLLT